MTDQTIAKGYTQTKVGIIPKDWEVVRLGDVGKVIRGLTYSPKNIDKNGILVLRSSNIQNRTLSFKNNVFVNTEEIGFNPVKENDILICVRNGSKNLIGKNSLIDKDNEGVAFGAFMSVFRSNDNMYLFQLFNTDFYKKQVYQNLGATINSINNNDLKRFKIPLPPKPEQQKIADILTTWDEAIEKQTALIQQKQQLKKGLMQQLLTGKTRFSEFSDEWQIVKLGDIFNLKKGSGLSKRKIVNNGIYQCVLYGELYTTYGEVISDIKSRTNVKDGVLSEIDDILIPASTTTTAIDLAIASTIQIDNVLLGGDINILRKKNNNICGEFIANYLTHIKQNKMAKYAQGITIIHLYAKHLKNLKILLPPLKEQQKIAQALSLADDEITQLQNELALLKTQKQGLMQQLLTGKIRVKT